MKAITDNVSTLMLVIGGLIALTNIFVEALKKIIPNDKFPTNLVAVITAVLLTLVAFLIYANIYTVVILWWHIVAAVIVGVLVAYGAMFGYDKLKEILKPKGE